MRVDRARCSAGSVMKLGQSTAVTTPRYCRCVFVGSGSMLHCDRDCRIVSIKLLPPMICCWNRPHRSRGDLSGLGQTRLALASLDFFRLRQLGGPAHSCVRRLSQESRQKAPDLLAVNGPKTRYCAKCVEIPRILGQADEVADGGSDDQTRRSAARVSSAGTSAVRKARMRFSADRFDWRQTGRVKRCWCFNQGQGIIRDSETAPRSGLSGFECLRASKDASRLRRAHRARNSLSSLMVVPI